MRVSWLYLVILAMVTSTSHGNLFEAKNQTEVWLQHLIFSCLINSLFLFRSILIARVFFSLVQHQGYPDFFSLYKKTSNARRLYSPEYHFNRTASWEWAWYHSYAWGGNFWNYSSHAIHECEAVSSPSLVLQWLILAVITIHTSENLSRILQISNERSEFWLKAFENSNI